MASLDPTVFVAAPRPHVYDYLADPRHRPEYQASLDRVELLDDGPPRVGMRWVDHLRGGMSFRLQITEMVPGSRWAENGTIGPLTAGVTLTFEDAERDGADGTLVRIAVRVHGRGAARPLGWLATGLLSAAVRLDLRGIARAAEPR